MAIRFTMPENAEEHVAFAYSPVLEAVLSLHVIVEPKHHPLQHPFVRAMRRLSPALRREIAAFRYAYRAYFPEFLFPSTTGGFATFEAELERLLAVPDELITHEFTRQFLGEAVPRGAEVMRRPEVIRAVRRAAALDGPRTAELVDLALEDPANLRSRFVRLIDDYWNEAFGSEWERIEPVLAGTVAAYGQLIASRGFFSLLEPLWPEVRLDRPARTFSLQRPHDHDVAVAGYLLLVPSEFVWPHVRVNCDEPWPLALVHPSSSIAHAARPVMGPDDVLRVLRVLGDDTRMRALRLIAERPRSTQELAPLVGISEAALSKHLRMLAEAGVLAAKRQGYYVLYSLEPDRIEGLTSSLLQYLGGDRAHGGA